MRDVKEPWIKRLKVSALQVMEGGVVVGKWCDDERCD